MFTSEIQNFKDQLRSGLHFFFFILFMTFLWNIFAAFSTDLGLCKVLRFRPPTELVEKHFKTYLAQIGNFAAKHDHMVQKRKTPFINMP